MKKKMKKLVLTGMILVGLSGGLFGSETTVEAKASHARSVSAQEQVCFQTKMAKQSLGIPKVSLKKEGQTLWVAWKKVKNAKGYQLYIKEGQGWSNKLLTTKRKYQWSPGAHTISVKFKVRAYQKVNGKKVWGKWSKWKKGIL